MPNIPEEKSDNGNERSGGQHNLCPLILFKNNFLSLLTSTTTTITSTITITSNFTSTTINNSTPSSPHLNPHLNYHHHLNPHLHNHHHNSHHNYHHHPNHHHHLNPHLHDHPSPHLPSELPLSPHILVEERSRLATLLLGFGSFTEIQNEPIMSNSPSSNFRW